MPFALAFAFGIAQVRDWDVCVLLDATHYDGGSSSGVAAFPCVAGVDSAAGDGVAEGSPCCNQADDVVAGALGQCGTGPLPQDQPYPGYLGGASPQPVHDEETYQ